MARTPRQTQCLGDKDKRTTGNPSLPVSGGLQPTVCCNSQTSPKAEPPLRPIPVRNCQCHTSMTTQASLTGMKTGSSASVPLIVSIWEPQPPWNKRPAWQDAFFQACLGMHVHRANSSQQREVGGLKAPQVDPTRACAPGLCTDTNTTNQQLLWHCPLVVFCFQPTPIAAVPHPTEVPDPCAIHLTVTSDVFLSKTTNQ